jgi:hypothetical protein
MKKKIIYGLLSTLILIQFIRPTRNVSNEAEPDEIAKRYTVTEEVHAILKHSCYDCHSNKTTYPWYANIQPVGWWMQHHVSEGKDELNFSVFGSYSEKRARHKFKEIEEAMEDGSMPITSYTIMQGEKKLSQEQAKAVADWAGKLK